MSDRSKWSALWTRLRAKGDPIPVHDALVKAYCEPHRAYHNLRHITDCLRHFEPVRSLAEDPDAVETALWLHDVVYDPRAKDNEERSAEFARRIFRAAEMPEPFTIKVSSLILVTRHEVVPATPDGRLVVDIDLSILGRDPIEFDEYERTVRKEYDWVPAPMFRAGRCKILQQFLDRPSIYFTDAFRSKFEEKARRNLARSIALLR